MTTIAIRYLAGRDESIILYNFFTLMNIYESGKVVLLLLFLMLVGGLLQSQSNEGREFWLGFMEHRDVGANDMVLMITSRLATSGTIEIPGVGFSESFTVGANDVTVVQMPTSAETIGSEFVGNNAIHVTSRDDISVYMHQFFGMRSEASVVLPTTAIGSSYYVIAYTGVPLGVGGVGPHPSEFLIVATQDETTVTYTQTAASQNLAPEGSTHTITLNAGELYQVRASNPLDDLTGSFVTADKDIALYAGTAWSQVPMGCGAMDNLLEQMYPISTWGTRYVASPFANTTVDLYRVIASQDDTEIDIQGSFAQNISLDAGEFFDFQTSDGVFVEGSKPISVAQYIIGSFCNGGVGDPSMVILNTVEQIRDTVTLFNSSFFDITEQFINVTTRTSDEDLIFIDGLPLSDRGVSFQPIGDAGDFSFAIIPVDAGAHTLFSSGCGIIAMAYGYGNVESYAYSGGASFTEINENQIPPGGCLNDTIFFDTGLPEDRYNVAWDLGDGTMTSEHVFEHQYDELGSYPVSLIIEDICFDEIDTSFRDLMVTLRQDISAVPDASGCEGSDVQLEAFDLGGATYEWVGPSEFMAEEQFPIVAEITLDQAGLYQVVGNISGCKTFPQDVFVEVFENPEPELGSDIVICAVDGETETIEVEAYSSYLWQDGSTRPNFLVDEAGLVALEVTDDNGCIGRDSLQVISQCPTRFYIPNAFSPNGDGVNDTFGVSGLEIISMTLQVFDRWGSIVYETSDEEAGWDGTVDGRVAAEGEYVWRFSYMGFREDATLFGDEVTGSLLLVR